MLPIRKCKIYKFTAQTTLIDSCNILGNEKHVKKEQNCNTIFLHTGSNLLLAAETTKREEYTSYIALPELCIKYKSQRSIYSPIHQINAYKMRCFLNARPTNTLKSIYFHSPPSGILYSQLNTPKK